MNLVCDRDGVVGINMGDMNKSAIRLRCADDGVPSIRVLDAEGKVLFGTPKGGDV